MSESGDKRFNCPTCQVTFLIEVEPGVPPAEKREHYPDSVDWITNLGKDDDATCPECGSTLEEG